MSTQATSSVIQAIIHRAKSALGRRRIVLPEWRDPRVLHAAAAAQRDGIAQIIIPANRDALTVALRSARIATSDFAGIQTLDPANRPEVVEELSHELFKRRGGKDLPDLHSARLKVQTLPLYFGNLLLSLGYADGQVAGSLATTADVVRSALHCVGIQKDMSTVSSFMIMVPSSCLSSPLIFSDCGTVIDPTPEQLAEIAIQAADNSERVLEQEPIVAMLSFSTKGSASHPLVNKVVKATEIVRRLRPSLRVDGELQFDAALDASVGDRKAPGSNVAGKANVFIFPDLNAGNIGYKIAERIGGMQAIGPIMQGLLKPSNDLSRGCSDRDIVHAVAVTVLQARPANKETVGKQLRDLQVFE